MKKNFGSKSKIGFGIIGCGFAGRIHAEAISNTKMGKVQAFCSRDKEKAKVFAYKYNADWYTDLDKFLNCNDIQVVNICTPSSLHSDIAIKAAEAGKHLIVEKPLDVTTKKCDTIIDAARKNRVKLTVIYQHRFKEAVQALKSAIEMGRFGKLLLGDAYIKWYRTPEYYNESEWKGTKKYDGGGALINQGIHTIDLLLWMMGDVKEVYGKTKTLVHSIEVEDTAVAIIEFKNGALGVIEAATSTYPGFDERLEIYGENGAVCIEGNRIVTWKFRDKMRGDEGKELLGSNDTSGGAKEPTGISTKLHQRQIEDMINAILNDRDPLITGEEARKSVALIERIYSSSLCTNNI